MTIENKIAKWLDEITTENKEEFENGTFEFDESYLKKVNDKWESIRQFISNDSELIIKYQNCYNSFFPSGYSYFNEVDCIDDISLAAAAIGKKGGQSKTEAKRKASAENGKKGGRPKKSVE